MQNRTVIHFLRQAIGFTGRFELRIAECTVIARRRPIRGKCRRGRNRAERHAAGERCKRGNARDRLGHEPAPSRMLALPEILLGLRQRCHATVSFSSLEIRDCSFLIANRPHSRPVMHMLARHEQYACSVSDQTLQLTQSLCNHSHIAHYRHISTNSKQRIHISQTMSLHEHSVIQANGEA